MVLKVGALLLNNPNNEVKNTSAQKVACYGRQMDAETTLCTSNF